MLVVGCTRQGGATVAIIGVVAAGAGIALVATEEPCPDDSCRFGTDRGWGGRLLILSGVVMAVAGAIGFARAAPESDAVAAPPPPPASAPLVVDPNKRDTEHDRLATQASLAARRGDCAATAVAMKRIAELDASLSERLRREDVPIATCLVSSPSAP